MNLTYQSDPGDEQSGTSIKNIQVTSNCPTKKDFKEMMESLKKAPKYQTIMTMDKSDYFKEEFLKKIKIKSHETNKF